MLQQVHASKIYFQYFQVHVLTRSYTFNGNDVLARSYTFNGNDVGVRRKRSTKTGSKFILHTTASAHDRVQKKSHTSLQCCITGCGHDGFRKKKKKGHRPLIRRKMRLCKLTNALFIVVFKVAGSLIRQLFPSYDRNSDFLKFQKCLRVVVCSPLA